MPSARAKAGSRSPWFTPALFTFLEELRLHNDRDWFERNRERYVRDVRDPMLRFVAGAAPILRRLAPRLVADPRPVGGSMFRIHRDTRFSKDKTPYKTNAAASFRHAAGREVHGPGLYVSLAPGEVEVGGGVWHPEADPLRLIRKAIAERPAAWKRALSAPGLDRLTWWGSRSRGRRRASRRTTRSTPGSAGRTSRPGSRSPRRTRSRPTSSTAAPRRGVRSALP